MKKEKGITLIALVITIIIMLILVAVTISIITDGSLLDKSKKAAFQTSFSQFLEQYNLYVSTNYGNNELTDQTIASNMSKYVPEQLVNRVKYENREIYIIGEKDNYRIWAEELLDNMNFATSVKAFDVGNSIEKLYINPHPKISDMPEKVYSFRFKNDEDNIVEFGINTFGSGDGQLEKKQLMLKDGDDYYVYIFNEEDIQEYTHQLVLNVSDARSNSWNQIIGTSIVAVAEIPILFNNYTLEEIKINDEEMNNININSFNINKFINTRSF